MGRRNRPVNRMISGIACFLIAVIFIALAVLHFQETKLKAELYTEPITGTVQQCEAYQKTERSAGRHGGTRVKTYYAITIGYEIEKGHPLTIERREQTWPQAVGTEIPLMYNPKTGEAVRKSETVQDLKVYLVFGAVALIFAGVGLVYVMTARRDW